MNLLPPKSEYGIYGVGVLVFAAGGYFYWQKVQANKASALPFIEYSQTVTGDAGTSSGVGGVTYSGFDPSQYLPSGPQPSGVPPFPGLGNLTGSNPTGYTNTPSPPSPPPPPPPAVSTTSGAFNWTTIATSAAKTGLAASYPNLPTTGTYSA